MTGVNIERAAFFKQADLFEIVGIALLITVIRSGLDEESAIEIEMFFELLVQAMQDKLLENLGRAVGFGELLADFP